MHPDGQTLGKAIEHQKDALAKMIVDEQWQRNPEFDSRYGAAGHAKCVQDVKYNLAYLSEAVDSGSISLFADYIKWVKALFEGLKIPTNELIESLEITREFLISQFPAEREKISEFVRHGLDRLALAPATISSFLHPENPLDQLCRQYLDALLLHDRAIASRLILDAVAQGTKVKDIYLHVFQPTQYEIGRLWQLNQITVAQEHYCTAVTQMIMSQLYTNIFDTPKNGRRLVAACVGSELHEIGLRMVADFFEMDGWDTYYLGSNTPANSIVTSLADQKADVLAISATMTFHIKLVADLIRQVRGASLPKPVKILVGGYPFNVDQALWHQVGADAYAPNAEIAIGKANTMMSNLEQN